MKTLYDAIIVGSGPAGAWAAKQLKTKNILMLDVGNRPTFTHGNSNGDYYSLKKNPDQGLPILIGDRYESLSNIFEDYLSPKLKAPQMRYINRGSSESSVTEKGFNSQQSFATGGLANAWGAGTFRFQDYELQSFPFKSEALDPYYDILTKQIGISGCEDDLTPFYGTTKDLLPAIQKTTQISLIYQRYLKKKEYFKNLGIYFGHPRLAYKNYKPDGLDFYLSHNPSIYTPAVTIQELIEENKITYKPGVLVKKYTEQADYVEVEATDIQSNDSVRFRSKTLILAMGALNTSKCVLQSRNDFETRLPLLDNTISYVPFLFPKMLGLNWAPENVIGSPMTMVMLRESKMPIQISVYNVGSVLITDLLPSLPLSANYLPSAGKLLLPALVVAQVFYPDASKEKNTLHLGSDSKLNLNYLRDTSGDIEGQLIKHLRKIGLYSAKPLVQYPQAGNSFHYAGMLPMKAQPKNRYECDANGLLADTKNIFIADAANFPELPAKNHTFTIMANSMRIADWVQKNRLD